MRQSSLRTGRVGGTFVHYESVKSPSTEKREKNKNQVGYRGRYTPEWGVRR